MKSPGIIRIPRVGRSLTPLAGCLTALLALGLAACGEKKDSTAAPAQRDVRLVVRHDLVLRELQEDLLAGRLCALVEILAHGDRAVPRAEEDVGDVVRKERPDLFRE